MAKKKVYDIVPPEKKEEILGEIKENLVKRPVVKIKRQRERRPFPSFKKKFFGGSVFIIIALLVYWFFSTAKIVEINISPKLSPLTLKTRLLFSTSSSELILSPENLSKTIVPAAPISIEKTFTKKFFSSEVNVEEKAHGTIRVYNKHNRTISLVKGTRFLSSSEPTKQFHAQKKIVIPAGSYVDAPVEASEPGEDYNISPCTFSVPGLRNFSPPQLYYDIYGKSFSNMEGGRKDTIRKITKEDLEDAQKELLEMARGQVEALLSEAAGPDFKILSNTVKTELVQGEAVNAQEGEEIDSFVYEIKIRAEALKVPLPSLLEFAQKYIYSKLPEGKDFVKEFLRVKFLPEGEGGGETGETSAGLEIASKIYSKIDQESLKEIVRGRNKKEISRFVLEICPELTSSPRIRFNPIWARRASLGPKEVKVNISFEQ